MAKNIHGSLLIKSNIKPWLGSLVATAFSQCAKVAGLIPGQGPYKKQPMNT